MPAAEAKAEPVGQAESSEADAASSEARCYNGGCPVGEDYKGVQDIVEAMVIGRDGSRLDVLCEVGFVADG